MHEGEVLSDDLPMQPRAGWTRMGLAGESVRLRQSQVLSTDRLSHVDHYTVVAHVNAAIAAGSLRSPIARLCTRDRTGVAIDRMNSRTASPPRNATRARPM
jgi:hypothetical protein